MKIFGRYKNGNYTVTLLTDGTKIRSNDLDCFIPEKPESMDIKITNCCDMMCPFCHEDSKPDGKHGDIMNLKFLDTLLPYTELAIGGGNVLTHPDLIPFLQLCKEKKLICNMTLNQVHFIKSFDLVKKLIDDKLIYGLGVSLVSINDDLIKKLTLIPNSVIHVINGVHKVSDLQKLYDKNFKLLILGFKDFRRGVAYHKQHSDLDIKKTDLFDELPTLVNHFKATSFDNLALKQLDVKRLMPKEQWDEFYMGGDGKFTMYIDVVNKQFAKSSISTNRYELTDDIKTMFDIVRKEQ